ncbi:hypothetical protein DCS_01551 [Drechmeria coniospora]|uniref:Mmc protein n=1 Tax=Drechmeria coniospora TaxID=98403 RepID=A0A151GTG2_DRECN|nr:hypothetical protein DCS_01551 [Drechmeria coniospora]KYK60414.1 hypothetical protein DCS_01551 [Drechmeria coniospora]
MKFTAAAVLAAAAGATAHYASNVTYVTEVVNSYVTYCPSPTILVHGSKTYHVSTVRLVYPPPSRPAPESRRPAVISRPWPSLPREPKLTEKLQPGTVTITDCPCTISKPVIPTTAVVCHNCAPGYKNVTVPAKPTVVPTPVGTGSPIPPKEPAPIATAGAAKAVALTGAGLAGIVGLAAFIL